MAVDQKLTSNQFELTSAGLKKDSWIWPGVCPEPAWHWSVHFWTSFSTTWTSSCRTEQMWEQPPASESSLPWILLMWLCIRSSASWEWFLILWSSCSTFPHTSQPCPSSSTSVTIRWKCSPWSPVRVLIFCTSWLRSRTWMGFSTSQYFMSKCSNKKSEFCNWW